MKSFSAVLVIYAAFISPLRAQQHNRLTPEEKAAGWELLFDGTTTKGWRSLDDAAFPRSSWVVEDGALHTIGEPPNIPTFNTGDFTRYPGIEVVNPADVTALA